MDGEKGLNLEAYKSPVVRWLKGLKAGDRIGVMEYILHQSGHLVGLNSSDKLGKPKVYKFVEFGKKDLLGNVLTLQVDEQTEMFKQILADEADDIGSLADKGLPMEVRIKYVDYYQA